LDIIILDFGLAGKGTFPARNKRLGVRIVERIIPNMRGRWS
jgi:hypothetical protein